MAGKIDLHLHLDGSLSEEVVRVLAEEEGYDFNGKTVKECLTVGRDCASLADYLKCFELPGLLLQTEEALELASLDLMRRLESQGLVYAEIRFAPQLHTGKGMTQQQAVEAVARGVRKGCEEGEIEAGVLLCAMVNGGERENRETAELAGAYLKKGVAGLDLAGPEGAVPMERFQAMFEEAYRESVPFTIHAGECGSSENVLKAVSYGARRIGHGCGAMYSELCMEVLKREKITVEMCVTSNLHTRAVPNLKGHPLKAFLDRGIRVTCNTDNMTVSDTDLDREYQVIREGLGLGDQEIRRMNRYAAEAAFTDEETRARVIGRL